MRTRSAGRGFRSALALPAALAGGLALGTWADGPPPGRTGGFGEPTCRECHLDAPESDASGTLAIAGLPDRWEPGRAYRLTVALARPGLARAGFQLAARVAEGPCAGRSAGELAALDERTRVVVDDSTGVAYVHHTRAGTSLLARDSTAWEVAWTAPATAAGAVVFHVAGNAADGDDSPLGDVILTASRTSGGP